MKDRIFNNWKTSLMGLFLLIFGGVMVYMKIISWESFVAFVPFCLGLIYVKDTILKKNDSDGKII